MQPGVYVVIDSFRASGPKETDRRDFVGETTDVNEAIRMTKRCQNDPRVVTRTQDRLSPSREFEFTTGHGMDRRKLWDGLVEFDQVRDAESRARDKCVEQGRPHDTIMFDRFRTEELDKDKGSRASVSVRASGKKSTRKKTAKKRPARKKK